LIAACNSRGLREMELADTLSSVKDIFTSSLASLPKSKETGEVLLGVFFGLQVKPEVETPLVAQSFMEQMRKEILDFEEKISSKAYGKIRCTATSRNEWRQALLEKGDTAKFCVDSIVRLEHSPERNVILTEEDLASLSEVMKLCVALFQVSDGISTDCFRPPFSQEEKDEE
ncbi:bromodomain containing protein, partial [Aphelenchoides avenae]